MSRRPRQHKINLGGFEAAKTGVPTAFSDIYYSMMEIGWPSFIALVSVVFLLLNLIFGLIYAALPGAIANAQPGSIADGFFFSVETLGTVGYGIWRRSRGWHTALPRSRFSPGSFSPRR